MPCMSTVLVESRGEYWKILSDNQIWTLRIRHWSLVISLFTPFQLFSDRCTKLLHLGIRHLLEAELFWPFWGAAGVIRLCLMLMRGCLMICTYDMMYMSSLPSLWLLLGFYMIRLALTSWVHRQDGMQMPCHDFNVQSLSSLDQPHWNMSPWSRENWDGLKLRPCVEFVCLQQQLLWPLS